MTPIQLLTIIRQRYNAVGDQFFGDDEIYAYIQAAEMEIALETNCIKNVFTASTVIGQRSYSMPANTVQITRVEYNGHRIFPNDFVDDDRMTGNNADETITGTPNEYQIYGDLYYLRPVPAEVGTIRIFSRDMPSLPSASGTLDIPSRYHHSLADYALYCMFAKEMKLDSANYHLTVWVSSKKRALQVERLRDSGDSFKTVKDMDELYDMPSEFRNID